MGQIPDTFFDRQLGCLAWIGVARVMRAGAGLGIVHDFALSQAPDLVRVLPGEISLTRSFWLLRHADDRRVQRLARFARDLAKGLRDEPARPESLA